MWTKGPRWAPRFPKDRTMTAFKRRHITEGVGPVLMAGDVAQAVIAAIRQLNADAEVLDRGSYLRVLVPRRCVVTQQAVEKNLGRAFRLPEDLEKAMPSFQGVFEVSENEAHWILNGSLSTSDQSR